MNFKDGYTLMMVNLINWIFLCFFEIIDDMPTLGTFCSLSIKTVMMAILFLFINVIFTLFLENLKLVGCQTLTTFVLSIILLIPQSAT
jgi:hypothetical protein